MKQPPFYLGLRPFAPALFALCVASCGGGDKAVDYGDPTELSRPTTVDGITAYVVSPKAFDALAKPSAQIVVAAYFEGEPAPLRVRMGTDEGGEREATPEGDPGPGQRFSATLPVLHGVTRAHVTITDEAGNHARQLEVPLRYEGAEPAVAFRLAAGKGPGSTCEAPRPLAHGLTSSPRVCALGRVSTRGAAAAAVDIGVNGSKGLGAVPKADGSFEVELALLPNQAQGVEAVVVDAAGAEQAASHDVVHDDQPPELVLTQPATGVPRTDTPVIRIEGRASDPNGLASLRVEAPDGNVIDVPLEQSFSVDVPLAPGENGLAVVAIDAAENERRVDLGAERSRVLTLRPPASNRGGTSLLIDRTLFGALINEDEQKTIKLVDIALRPTVRAALERIRDPERFGVDVSTWGQAERNLQRLLSMNPDTADMRGTSIEEMLDVAAGIGLPPARLLSDLLDSGVTDPCVSLDVAADVMVEKLVGTHPNVTRDKDGAPALSISIYDVLQDLHTLSARFGPAGNHPGFLSGPTESEVLLPGFRFVLPVRSNLTEYDGVEASNDAKSALFILPSGLPALELDFTSDASQVVGLADEPAVDLVMGVSENPAFMKAGTSQTANPDPARPGFARGNSPVWALPPWQTESLLAEIVYQAYAPHYQASGYKKTLHYDAGSIHDAAILDWNKGWVTVTTAGGLGDPPHPQFSWDILLEVAQVRLHDGGIAEGQANLAFALEKLPIGLTGDELIARIKPSLQAQAPKLSELIAGPSGLVTPRADFYFSPGDAGGTGFLFFRAPEDAPSATYPYAKPGFYADKALSQKVSTKGAIAGTADAIHEKVAIAGGQTLYFADKTSKVYELRVLGPADGGGARVTVAPAGGAT